MKTNQVLTRQMGQFEVFQRTKDGMFNATALLRQWNARSKQKKDVGHYFENSATQEFVKALMSEENFTSRNSVYVKSRASRGSNAGTWMHPLMFIDFAMWLNPSFKVKVLKFVSDKLIEYRNEAGDAYKEMSAAITNIVRKENLSTIIPEVARCVNYVIFNSHTQLMRNNANESKMRELFELERDIAKLIRFEFISNIAELKSYLRRRWRNAWQPKELSA